MVKETAAELTACPVAAVEAVTKLSVFFLAVLHEPLRGSSALPSPLRWSSAPPLRPVKLPVAVCPKPRWSVPPVPLWSPARVFSSLSSTSIK